MSDKPLTPVQRSALLVLMAEGREIPNAFLTNVRKLDLKRLSREDLRNRRMIKVRKEGQLVFIELDDEGWAWCEKQFGKDIETPTGGGHGSAAAYAIMASIARAVADKRQIRALGDFFVHIEEEEVDVEAAIRDAYARLAGRRGAWVELAQLRPELNGIPRKSVDAALLAMSTLEDVSVIPESNQKTLTPEQRTAAVRIGNQSKHLISIQ